MTPCDKVFNIPELTKLIADDLSQHDLTFCCRVNKTFFNTFTPHLWHSITIHPNDFIPKFKTPESQAGLLRNGHHIRVLRSPSLGLLEPFLEYGKTCVNLVSLDTQYSYWTFEQVPRAAPTRRSIAMMSKGRRGSLSCGQRPKLDQRVGGVQSQSTRFGLGSSSSISGPFRSLALTPTWAGFGVPAAATGFGVPAADTGFGVPAAATGFGVPAAATGFGVLAAATRFSVPAAATRFGAPAATTGFGVPAAATGFGVPAAATRFGVPAAATRFGAPAATTGFGAPAATTGFGAPAATTGFGAPAPAALGFGAGTIPAIGFGASAAAAPAATGFGAPVTGGFHGYGATLLSSPAPTAVAIASKSPPSSSFSINTKPKAVKSEAVAEETILLTLLAQNPHLEYLALPSYCLEKEDVVALVGESLLSLKELHSQSDSPGQGGLWCAKEGARVARFSLFDRPVIYDGMRSVSAFTGYIRPSSGAGVVRGVGDMSPTAWALVRKYPRLRDLQLKLVATINREELDALRAVTDSTLTYLEIDLSRVNFVEQICHQVLVNTPGEGSFLTSIELATCGSGGELCFDNTVMDAFLRHAPTLEYIDVSGCRFCAETLQALLDNGPRLKSVKTMEDDLGYRPSLETELDFMRAIQHLWRSEMLEVFECKIVNVPRPDVFVSEIEPELDLSQWIPPPPKFTLETPPSPLAVQVSHNLQRLLLKNLGRCKHLRKLWLGTFGNNRNDPEYSYLDLNGLRRMVVDGYMQTSCLELSLTSGLDELSGLEELEELVVARMAHRIGLAEVKWMVEHWPRLRRIYGLEYYDYDDQLLDEEEEEERVVPECIVWLRENRPDIIVS
ncbi:hypothetical protein EC957_005943 [Mortierella hygrophila]|uniref:F-box domain-containing protein n=1 Tax=Mortierella hygrophila TaxID=979708 RepID=A0A9P6FEZ7_9FUNG|nr:hypothetical protein EC957_005943 [Mortierella hygrophila]